MVLKIYLLGQFKLSADNHPIELPSRPAQSLLAYLVLNAGVTHRREKLAGLLWPEATEPNARSYLRQALWRIRKSFESGSLNWEDYLQISDISVEFDDQADYWLDAGILLEKVERKPVEEIVDIVNLYRGELLPGFYDEWVVLERDRLQAAYHQKMNVLLESLIQVGRWDQALKWGEQWIRLGYAPEPAYRALMNAHAGLGDQAMVSATYQRCVESLNRELGMEPSPETQNLYEQILRGELEVFVSPPTRLVDLPDQRPPFLDEGEPHQIEKPIFVARKRELAQLDSDLNLALAGQGRVIFVTGEAGSGKTALVHEFTQRAQDTHTDLIVASGNCNAHTGIGDPYLPFREVLEMLTGDVEARWAAGAISAEHARHLWNTLPLTAQVVVEHGPDLIDTFVSGSPLLKRATTCSPARTGWLNRLDSLVERKATSPQIFSAQQSDFFDQYTRVLQDLSRKIPLVLVVDDLQWTDTGSVGLLFRLGRHLAGNRILIVGAYRSEEVALGRGGERHPLEPVVNELQRVFGDIVINLDKTEGHDFLEAILDSEPNRLGIRFRNMLQKQTGGQPLFTIELLRGMQERGDLLQDQDGNWIEGPALDWETMPARVEAVIAERIGRLSQPLRAALRVASVEGETFTAEVVASVQATGAGEIMRLLSRELDRRHRLIHTQSIRRINGQLLSRYRFRHILIQKYLYSSLDEVERVYLHEKVGITLEGLYRTTDEFVTDPTIAPQLARHFQEARITDKTIGYLHLAGEKAVQLSAYQEARVHLTRAKALLKTMADTPERMDLELSIQIALGMAWMGFPGIEWENASTRALELCRLTGKTSQLCRVLGNLSIIHYVRAEHHRALELAEELLSQGLCTNDPINVALGHWQVGLVLFVLGEYAIAREHFGKVIRFYIPKEHHQPFVFLQGVDVGVSAMAYEACCQWCLGYPDLALQHSQEALALARELDHPFTLADVVSYAGCLFNHMQRDGQAFKENAEELERLSNEKVPAWLGAGMRFRGEALAMLGQVQEGITLMHNGMATCQSLGNYLDFSRTLGSLAKAQSVVGLPKQGLATLDKALAIVEDTDERLWEPELHRTRAEIQKTQGEIGAVEVSLSKAIEIAHRQNAKSWELRATTDLAHLWHEMGRSDEAREMLGEIYVWFSEGFDTRDLKEAKVLLEKLS